MLRYILRRILNLIPVLLIISIILFGMSEAMPGNPIDSMIPQNIQSETQREALRKTLTEKYNLDGKFHERYIGWLTRVFQGEFGQSTQYQKDVSKVIGVPLRNTLILNLGSTIIAFFLSLIIGIKSAIRKGKFYDKFWQVFSLAGISLPTFFTAMILIYIFAIKLNWLPAGSMPIENTVGEWIRYLILPTITLTIGSLASTSRYVRNSMIDALSQDYIRTARAKGLSEKTVIYSHAFRNALIPVVTVVAWSLTGLLSGAAVTEELFAYNGIGKHFLASVLARDYNVIMTLNMMYSVLAVAGNLLMDIGYSLVDPRVKLQ